MLHNSRSALQLFADRLHARSPLTHEEQGALMSLKGNSVLAKAGLDIVSPGNLTDHACLVIDGLVGRFGLVIDGKKQITALYVAGDMCDLESVVTPTVSWALQALSPTVVLRIPHRELQRIVTAHPKIAEAFWRDCSVDASVLSQWVVNVGRRDARCRMAHLLCEMAVRLERIGLGSRTSFTLNATQTQLGDALGLTPVHVNRTARSLREDGLVTIRANQVRVADWGALVALADFDEAYLHVEPAREKEFAA